MPGTYTALLTVTDDKGATAQAGVLIVVADPGVLAAPTNLPGRISGSTVTLNWVDNSGNETGFKIDRGVQVGKITTRTENLAAVGPHVTTYRQSVASGTYVYRVRAVNRSTGRFSDNSNEIQVRVGKTGAGGAK